MISGGGNKTQGDLKLKVCYQNDCRIISESQKRKYQYRKRKRRPQVYYFWDYNSALLKDKI